MACLCVCVSMCVCVYVFVCVCVCVCVCAFIFFYRQELLLSKLMSEANINAQVSDIMLHTLADSLSESFPYLSLHLQNSKILAQQPTGIIII